MPAEVGPAASGSGDPAASGSGDPWAALPASGAWRAGDPVGRRSFAELVDPLTLELGATLPSVTVAYETWGTLAADRSNAVLVLHALTGDSHLAGPVGPGHPSPGWWDPIVGPGGALDPAGGWFVVCPNVLGGCQGTTGPSSPAPDGRPWGSRFPELTIRDQVAAEVGLADVLGIDRWAAVVGGSMGGMRVLEWAVGRPERVDRAVVVACGAAATAEQIAWCAVQAQAIRLDPGFAGGDYYDAPAGAGPTRGLGVARRLGHITYRSEEELDARFGRRPQPGEQPLGGGWAGAAAGPPAGRYGVESYLDHQAAKLAARFDANSYLVLSRAMDHHDIGRDRGGVAAALARITAAVTVGGVDSDRLYPLRLQEAIADSLPDRPPVHVITSGAGHDGFLTEVDQIDKIVAGALS